MNKKNINPAVTLSLAVICWILQAVIGGLIGDFINFLGFVLFCLGIVSVIERAVRERKLKKKTS